MDSFVAVNRYRSICKLCGNEVSNQTLERHLEYHSLGDLTLGDNEVACPYCLTPKNIASLKMHLMDFHNFSQDKSNRIFTELKESKKNNVLPQIETKRGEPETKRGEPETKRVEPVAERAQPARGRRRIIPNLVGETDIEREKRLNREAVQRFRAKKRLERGLGPPKQYDRTIIEGETQEEREKRKNREYVRAYRARRRGPQ